LSQQTDNSSWSSGLTVVSERLLAYDFNLFPAVPLPGLLAGLYEFPSFVDVSRTSSHGDLTAEILSKLQIDHSHLTKSTTKSVGDVQHIFSHIKKTYRTRWIVLESKSQPPPPFAFDFAEKSPSKKNKSRNATLAPVSDEKVNTRWVSLKEVEDMKSVYIFYWLPAFSDPDLLINFSMGTGVAKIWNLTKRMWE
jgi:A/G-specific adenine glycosylase